LPGEPKFINRNSMPRERALLGTPPQLFVHKQTGQVAYLMLGNGRWDDPSEEELAGSVVTIYVPFNDDPVLRWPDYTEDESLKAQVEQFGRELMARNPLVSGYALGRIKSTGEQVIGVGMISEDWLPHPPP